MASLTYAPQEEPRLRFAVELAAGEYWGLHVDRSEVSDEQRPIERSQFVRDVKKDPLLLWMVAEWWFKDGHAREEL